MLPAAVTPVSFVVSLTASSGSLIIFSLIPFASFKNTCYITKKVALLSNLIYKKRFSFIVCRASAFSISAPAAHKVPKRR